MTEYNNVASGNTGYSKATMYVISEQGLETGPFLYGKATDSRVVYLDSGFRGNKQFYSALRNAHAVRHFPTKGAPEFGPRATERACVVNLNDVLCKYQGKFRSDDFRRIGHSGVLMDSHSMKKEFNNTYSGFTGGGKFPGGQFSENNSMRTCFQLRGSQNTKSQAAQAVERRDEIQRARRQSSSYWCVEKDKLPFSDSINGNRFSVNTQTGTKEVVEDEKLKSLSSEIEENFQEKSYRRSGELCLLKKIYFSKGKNRAEGQKHSERKGEIKWETRRELKQCFEKQGSDQTGGQESQGSPLKSHAKRTVSFSRLKLPVVAAGKACDTNPVTFERRDYDRWSRKERKFPSVVMSSTGASKSGKVLLPSIARKC